MNKITTIIVQAVVTATLTAGVAACGGNTPGGTPATASNQAPPASTPPAEQSTPAAAANAPPDSAAEPAAPPPAADGPRYASVISVQPIKQKVDHPREDCRDERVVHKRKPKDDHQIAGTVIGAVAGGVLGHQVGGGRGKDVATVAGAIGGGIAGKKIQESHQDRQTYTTIEHRCRTVNEPSEDIVAYEVVYEYLGSTHQVRLDHDPGDKIELPVRGID